MKCGIKSLLALMAGAVMLGSCSDDYFETKTGAAKTGNMSFTATVDGADSRASFTGDSLSFMKPNSEISVLSDGQNSKFTKNDGGLFTGNCKESEEYYAVSPYNAIHSWINSNRVMIYWNGTEQTVDLNENYAPMVACTKNVEEGAQCVPLKFQSVCSFIKFTTDYVCKSITLKSRGGEGLVAKTVFVYCDGNSKPNIYLQNGLDCEIRLTGKDGGNIEAGTYYIPVLPGKLSSGVDMTFTNKYNEKTCTRTLTNSGRLVCGEAIDLGTVNIKSEMIHLAGKGTEADPYLIHDFDQLMEMHDFVNNSTGGGDCYKLANDIDCQGHEISPIGNFDRMFCGTFDGGNHCIKNLRIKGSMEYILPTGDTNRACALFAVIKGATIKNLTIESPSFNPENNGDRMTFSPFVGITYCADANYDASRCRFLNCKLTGECTVSHVCDKLVDYSHFKDCCTGFIYGGFVGCNESNLELTDCTMDMKLNASYSGQLADIMTCTVGGFVGIAYGANNENSKYLSRDGEVRINRCRNNSPKMYVDGKDNGAGIRVSGFIGAAKDEIVHDVTCFIQNSVNNAPISVTGFHSSYYIGGFVAYHDSDGDSSDPCFTNCVNNGDLYIIKDGWCYSYIGGFTAYNFDNDTKFINCANTGKLSSSFTLTVGAISALHGTFTNCYNCQSEHVRVVAPSNHGEPESVGKMTNTGYKTIDEVVETMNSTELVWKNGDICNWRKKTVNGREILDLYTVRGPNIPQ